MLPTRCCGTDCVMFYITQLDIHKTVSPAASGRQHVMTTFISLLPLSDCKLITINKYVKGAATNVYTFSLLFKSKTIFNQIKFTLLSWPSATTQQRRKGGDSNIPENIIGAVSWLKSTTSGKDSDETNLAISSSVSYKEKSHYNAYELKLAHLLLW